MAVLWFATQGAGAQVLKVVDQNTLQPVPGAGIANTRGQTFYTDSKGRLNISQLQADSVTIEAAGYQGHTYTMPQLKERNFVVSLPAKTIVLNEVVVSANRFEEKARHVPQKIVVIGAKELQFMNQPTTADMLQQSGTVLVQKSQLGGGSPIIRGFEANKILLVMDGVRLNNAIYRGGHLQNSITIDHTMLEQAEVIFGPGSVMYGSDALGGVIHFHTKNPQLSSTLGSIRTDVNAYTRYATAAHEKTGHVDVNIGLKKFAFLTGVTYSDFNDLRQGNNRNKDMEELGKRSFYPQRLNGKDSMIVNSDPNVQRFSGYRQIDLLQKVLLQQNTKINHLVNVQYSTSTDIPRYDRLTEVDSKGILKNAEWYYGPQKRLFSSYQVNLTGSRFFTNARITAAYQHIEESRHNRSFGKNTLNHRLEKVDVWTLNADFTKAMDVHTLYYGVEGAMNEVNSTAHAEDIRTGTTQPLDTRYPNGGSTMRTLAAYVTHTWKVSPSFTLTEGLRYSNTFLHARFADKQFFPFPFDAITQQAGALNGNVGLVWRPATTWRFTVLGNSGFRAPNVDDLAKVFESVPGNLIVPNRDLKPEFTYNAEAGIAKTFADRVQVEATGFYTWYQDAITTQPFQLNGNPVVDYNTKPSRVIAQVNAGKAYIYGANLQLTLVITPAISLLSSLNYTYGRIKTDSTDYPLDHIAPLYGKTGLNTTLKKYRGEFFVLYNGWKRLKDFNKVGEDNLQYATPNGSPAWYTLNARVSYQFNSILQVQVALENILDRNYRVFASGISAPGRNLMLTVRGTF